MVMQNYDIPIGLKMDYRKQKNGQYSYYTSCVIFFIYICNVNALIFIYASIKRRFFRRKSDRHAANDQSPYGN